MKVVLLRSFFVPADSHLRIFKPAESEMPAAKCDVAFVSSDEDLLTFTDNLTVDEAGVEMRFLSAPANGWDLFDHICEFKEPGSAGKHLALEIRAKTVADDRDVQEINNVSHIFDFLAGHELGFIYNDAGVIFRIFRGMPILFCICDEFIDIFAGSGDADPGRDDLLVAIAVVYLRLEH